jgi:hypothetical protein
MFSLLKKNKKYLIDYFLLFVSTYISTVWINFYYISPRNVDFNKYYDYINYFFGLDVEINYGQGSLYYLIVSNLFKRNLNFIDERSLEIILSYAIQNTNLIFYLIGLLGLYKLLYFYNFDKKLIIFTLSILNFFPQAMYVRAVMKPEIIAFSFFPWIIFFIENYKKDKSIINLYFASPFLIITLTSKGSLAGMAILYLVVAYFSDIKNFEYKKYYIFLIIFFIVFSIVLFENYEITNNHIFERNYDESYDNKAEFSSIFRFNLQTIFNQPFFDYEYQIGKFSVHANSIINVTILDSFGDYFNQLYDSNLNYFEKNRKDLFTTDGDDLLNSNNQILYIGPFSSILDTNLNLIRKTLSSLYSFFFYFSLVIFIFVYKSYRKYYIMPFIGIITLYINSLGFPSNNFNPYFGDTYKAFYYSFLISIAFVFVVMKYLELIKSIKFLKYVFLIFWLISIGFIAGHPKSNDQNFSEYLATSNQYSLFCNVNNLIFFENNLIQKIHPSGNINNLSTDCKKYKNTNLEKDFSITQKEICISKNTINKAQASTPNCRIYLIDRVINKVDLQKIRYPLASILVFLSALFLTLGSDKFKTKLTN